MDWYIGEIRLFAGNYAPEGWALCNGALLPIAGNETLYSLIGTTYGGGGTNFNLPNLIGRLPVSLGKGGTLTNTWALGQVAGTYTVGLTAAQMPTHTHNVNANGQTGTSLDPTNNTFAAASAGVAYIPTTAAGQTKRPLDAATLQNAGGSQPHANCMPTLGLTYIIATTGIYPDRP